MTLDERKLALQFEDFGGAGCSFVFTVFELVAQVGGNILNAD